MQPKENSTGRDLSRQAGAGDIAIVGMACRFPGAADYDEYWQNLLAGRNCIREVPSDRWDWRQIFGDPRVEPNKTNVKWGGFIDDVDKFDPLFFGIAPNEAAFIDPQHRLFLEAAWHAVEDAGYSVASLAGKAIGVYAGVSKNDYAELMRESRHEIAPYISTGTVHSILANRVSFLFNLHGRSEVVDTACSSSMVALHNAIRDIASGECEGAIVGGVNALLTPTMFISHSKSGMLSPDGQCKTFSDAANGYVRGEGVGVLYIKPLHRAVQDGDHIHAVIKGSAINHGGRSNFLTSPTTEAQAAVVMSALRRGNVDPRTVDYIEAHGTGTPLGDPIEINGLKKAFAQVAQEFPQQAGDRKPHCVLSAVKTNIGHLESAAGMAGIIKVVMAMRHRQIPAIRNFDRLNQYIELADSPFSIATETMAWESNGHPRRAGVSSFGMGGVNAHVVLEEAPATSVAPVVEGQEYLFVLSAKKGRLKPYAQSFIDHLARYNGDGNAARLSLRDAAFTLQTGRDAFDERLAVVAASTDELIGKLARYVGGETLETPNELAVADRSGDSAEDRPRRVPLPTYPFARKRCWFTDVPSRMSTVVQPSPAPVRTETSGFARTLRATDFFIRDHVVQGKPMLPGVVHLELARAAGSAAQRVRVLKDVYWMTPVVVEGKDVPVEIRLMPLADRINFELQQGNTVHSKGSLADLPAGAGNPRKVDIAAIQARCIPGKSKAELYALLKEHGLAYGSSFQVIDSYVDSETEILAELKLPEDAQAGGEEYALHPSIMDGVFQAVTALSLLGLRQTGKQFVPFYLETAEIAAGTGGHCFVHATVNEASAPDGKVLSFHAVLTDSEGNVLVSIRNLQKRPIAGRVQTETVQPVSADVRYLPVWRRRALTDRRAAVAKTLVVFAHDASIVESFRNCGVTGPILLVRPGAGFRRLENDVYEINPAAAADYERLLQKLKDNGRAPAQVAYLWGMHVQDDCDMRGSLETTIYGVLQFTQAAFKARFRETVSLVYAHPLGEGFGRSIHSMVAGFARTLKYENPKFDYVTVGIDQPALDDVARIVIAELGAAAEAKAMREIAYRGGERHERTIVRDTVANSSETAPALRTDGVYVVAGGAGGLGAVFSRHLATNHRATILWLGRSVVTPAIAAKMEEIEAAGGKCQYFRVDITDREALQRVFAEIKTAHGEIHGVIHAAGLIEDAFILRKQRDSFARVVEPKILGAMHLDELTRQEPLDFFVVFSSIAALMPNQGQCDYAAANSFLDSFVEARNRLTAGNQRSGVSLAINWPLWAHGGMRVTAEEERHLLRVFGMKPLATADGLALFETSLSLAKARFPEIHQIIAIGGNQETIERSLGVDASEMTDQLQPSLETTLKAIFAARLNVRPETIAGGRTIGELGVDSMSIVGVIQDVNQRFGVELKPTLLFDINTIDKLAAYLTGIGKDKPAVRVENAVPRFNRSLIDPERSDRARRVFSKTFSTSEFYMRDHVVDGEYNVPGACYVEMARQAGDLLLGEGSVTRLLHNYWASPLSSPHEDFTAQVLITPKQDQFAYEVVSFGPAGEKRLHAMGQLIQGQAATEPEIRIDLVAVRSRCTEVQYPEQIYAQIHGEGLIVGPMFQPMTHILLNEDEALAMLELPEEIRSTIGDYVMNPALLTGAFQTSLISNRRDPANTRRYIPIGMDELEILGPIPAECCIYSRPRPANVRNEEMRKFDVDICRPDGLVVVRLKGFSIRALKEAAAIAESRDIAVASTPTSSENAALLQSVRELIKTKLAGPIGLSADEIDESVEFDQYGVTSVMVVELNQIFEDILGAIPKTLFFEYRNVTELAEYFVENHREVLTRVAKATEAPVAAPAPSATVSTVVADPIDDVREYLRALIAGPIGLAAEEIDVHTGFDQYGVNSVMVVELNERFEQVFGPLSKTLFFEYRSIDELGRYFLEEHRDAVLSVARPKPVAATVAETPAPIRTEDSGMATSRAAAVEEGHDIAIVSAAGRFPGAQNLEQFWDVLREGRDCITEIPADRFNYRKYYDADPEQNGIYAKWGGFIDGVDRFDPAFFNISGREAELIDPQERLLLEVVWEMLERAGYTRQRLHRLSDRKVGVFVGALWQPYESAGIEATLAGNVTGPSSLLYSIANRVSYFFDLAGPSMAIDTACSSSLTALHLACQSIRDGESQFAIAAGVNLSLSVSKYLFLSRYRFLSTDGRCRSYGAGGDGYVPGEGICAVLLKPLAKAIADGDSILGVIKGSAVNHGGRTNGYTVPNPKSQGSVIANALESARVDPRNITYIEGHGTGTSLGDPIEISGLEKALGLSKDGDRVCAIGSVKSNIGHLEAAAGMASLIKVLLQMQHGQLVPSLHSGQLNPNIDFARSPFRVQRELGPWARPVVINDGKAEQLPRCAGISSFGAGGSNAHVIVEQYDGAPAPALRASGPALCVFSARTEERLVEMAGRFSDYLRGGSAEELHEIAYTLQLGREAMRERFAVVANSIDELQAALADLLGGTRHQSNWRRGRVAGRGAQTETSVEGRNLLEVAEAWVQGREIDWTQFYGERQYGFRMLPTYPFAKERYWLDTPASEPVVSVRPAALPAPVVLHPLLHSNTSDLSGQRYTSTFSGDEFFLADHEVLVDGRNLQKVLPGVACLEMVRAAIEHASSAHSASAVLELHNTVWLQPIIVSRDKQLSVALAEKANGEIDYKVYGIDGEQEVLHCQGRAVWGAPAEPLRLDLERIDRQMNPRDVEGSRVYEAFVRTGGVYGPTFQGIAAIRQGRDQLLARLRLPAVIEHTLGDYYLHPTVMDGALQGYLGLVDDWFQVSGRTRMPFALESLRILSPCTRAMVAWMRLAPGSQAGDQVVKLDVDLCDEQGRVCVQMKGFSVRALDGEKEREVAGLVTLAPVWDAVQAPAGDELPGAGERVVVIGGEEAQRHALWQQCSGAEALPIDGGSSVEQIAATLRSGARIDHLVWILPAASTPERLIADQEEGVLLGFRLVKALLSEGYGAGELRWTIVTTGTQRVGARQDELNAAHASVRGLAGSLAKEYRNWKIRLADVATSECPWGELLRLPADDRGDGWAHRDGQWYKQRLVPCGPAEKNNQDGFKRAGVYVVIGGAGGVGEVLSQYLIRKYDARVVWIGRREQDAAIEAKQARVAAGGGEQPLYIAADARKREDLEQASREIKQRYGRIDGVIHSAIVLADKSLANMEEEQFRAALSTKVDTAVRMAEVFGREPLDFILYFSSLQSFLKAPGQSNYAAGCTFTDAFAEWQSANAGYPVKVMNWGYWANVGIVAAPEYQERMARMGWGSLEAEEGMAGVERLLTGPFAQLGMIRTNGEQAARTLGFELGETISVAQEQAPSLIAQLAGVASLAGPESAEELDLRETQRHDFDAVLAKMLQGLLARVGETPRVTAEYDRWLEESLRILGEHDRPWSAAGDEAQLWAEWELEKGRWEAQGLGAQVKLVETTLRSLGPILRGEKRATDVMFPNSSLALVEGVYKNHAVADYFNRVMADVVRWYAGERCQESSPELRLLELGAGTGGSSQGILRMLDAYRQGIAEYCYSDVSKVFLLHGEREYGAGRDYLKYAVVDVEKGLEEQGVERGVYDVVLAANVLHATRRLRETLRNAKAALKANGLIVLNEITTRSVFMHLTFGLLPGWWAYEDAELRMGGSPGLTPEAWQRVLEEEGFRAVCFPAHAAQGSGQQIIVAESDGIIRQKHAVAARPRRKIAEAVPAQTVAAVVPAADPGLREKVEAWLVDAVGLLLKVKREDADPDAELSELGFDSISLTGFANHVNQAYALELMPTIFFEHPTIKRFAGYLVETHGQRINELLAGPVAAAAPSTTRNVVTATPAAQSAVLLEKAEQWLIEAIGVLLKVKREDVDPEAELSECGFDSISLTGFANHVNQAFDLELMPTIFFEHPTVRRLAGYLVDRHAERLNAKFGVVAQSTQPAPAHRVRVVETEAAPSATEPIAIIGMSGRFPGADDLDAFWENLQAGTESIREIPRSRWDWQAFDGKREDGTPGGAQWGAFMEGVDRFDPLFFGISPREAERMDPQHRLTMMYGWKAFEDAGYGPKQLWGSRTGVFVGTTSTGYSELLLNRDGAGIEGYTATGLVPSVGPNRISYLLNLHGPSEPVETACSSSLVAVHRGVRSIMAGECEMVLAGGVNTLFPTLHTSFNKAGMLSPDGKCKTFSSRADGYARGEGVGMVVLKKLSAAERDGDHIYGLIVGTAENHGGRAQSLTAPNPTAQAELIKDAYRRAGVSPRSVSYIEAHGTGTPLGDPIEINGLKMAFQGLYEETGEVVATGYCGLGSVKTNIGHLELAAGIAGLIKLLLQLKHKTLVRTLHCDEVNPYIQLEASPFYIVKENQPWSRLQDGAGREWPLRAGVSSFGFGGVNAHVVVEEYAGAAAEKPAAAGPVMVVLSARDGERLKEQATQLRRWIVRRELTDGDLAGLAYTSQVGREAMDHRLAMTVASMQELEAKLAGFVEGKSAIEGLYRGEVKRNSETLALFRGDDELREAVDKWMQRGKWSKVLELWVKGLEIEWELAYGDVKPGRVSLPTYPFANVRCWIDASASSPVAAAGTAVMAVLHPLLHQNLSDLTEQRYSSTFTGGEFFLTDHQIRHGHISRKVLPGVAFLEMARAAVRRASRNHVSSILELHDTIWLKPVVVTEPIEVSISLSANDDESVDYGIYSVEAGQEIVHCQGRAVFVPQPASASLDLEQLRGRMVQGRLTGSELYAKCERMGLHYGPAHQGITALYLGEQQLLAELRLPSGVAASQHEYVLHPSVMDSALQASLGLFIDWNDLPEKPSVPFGLQSIRILSSCTAEMTAWVRQAKNGKREDKTVQVDIDLCDRQGNVCVQLRGLASRVLEGDGKSARPGTIRHRVPLAPDSVAGEAASFDDAFYESLIADIVNRKVSADEAAELE